MLIFIGGSSRSGTTLMSELLTDDQNTNTYLPESVPLQHLLHAYQMTCRFRQNAAYFAEGHPRCFYRQCLMSLLAQVPALADAPEHTVLKCPTMTPFFPELDEILDDARYVVMVRDPRDIVTSQIKVARRQSDAGSMVRNPVHAREDVHRMSINLLKAYEPVLRQGRPASGSRLLWLRYEDLVGDPETAVASLRQHTGLKLRSFSPSRPVGRNQDLRNGGFRTELSGRAISDANVGSFAGVLDPSRVRTVETVCAPFMRLFGYSTLHVQRDPGAEQVVSSPSGPRVQAEEDPAHGGAETQTQR